MLHAFMAGRYQVGNDPMTPENETSYYDMGTGIEKFGWVPRAVFPTLKQLTLKGAHPVYVDGAITVADAWFPASPSDVAKETDEWATTLVVGMRNGAESYLALDVTDPNETDSDEPHGPYPKFLWEFADPNEPLGRTWSKAVITRVRLRGSHADDHCGPSNGDGAAGPAQPGNCREEWVAIFGAGYLEQGDPSATGFLSDPNAPSWEDDSKGIFVVSLKDGQVLARVSYEPGTGPTAQMRYSLPSEPAVLDLNFDGFADVVYIGDTGGQLWKWDLSATGVRDMTGRVPTSVWPVNRFFVAPPALNGHRRSFFFPPTASFVGGKLVLALGTGERTKPDYRTTGGDENRYYVIQDRTPTGTGAFVGLPLTETNLTPLAANGVDTNPLDFGYYVIADRDEKYLGDSLVFSGFVITTSYVPKPPNPAAPCDGGGEGRLYIFSLGNGAGFFAASEPGLIDSRRVTLGAGMPSSASITVSGNEAQVGVQMTDMSRKGRKAPPPDNAPVDVIYWQQDF
jgi:type IV pilus assembly protein PilY1